MELEKDLGCLQRIKRGGIMTNFEKCPLFQIGDIVYFYDKDKKFRIGKVVKIKNNKVTIEQKILKGDPILDIVPLAKVRLYAERNKRRRTK